jgi:hypothetical protein
LGGVASAVDDFSSKLRFSLEINRSSRRSASKRKHDGGQASELKTHTRLPENLLIPVCPNRGKLFTTQGTRYPLSGRGCSGGCRLRSWNEERERKKKRKFPLKSLQLSSIPSWKLFVLPRWEPTACPASGEKEGDGVYGRLPRRAC